MGDRHHHMSHVHKAGTGKMSSIHHNTDTNDPLGCGVNVVRRTVRGSILVVWQLSGCVAAASFPDRPTAKILVSELG